ncbi:MAG: tRNA (guanosine(46)-N7)-methyltransferase TrmB [Myxococcota bacterium]
MDSRVNPESCAQDEPELLCGRSDSEAPRRYDEVAPRAPLGDIDLRSVTGGSEGLELDIGFGRGQSLLRRARLVPHHRIIGIEIKTKWAYRVAQRCLRESMSNVVVWTGDAVALLARCSPSSSVHRVFVHFPDPWWKKRHQKRLLLSPPFLDTLARLMRPKGELYIQTDVEERAEQVQAMLRVHPLFDEPCVLSENPYGNPSNRELRAEQDGLPVHRIRARRAPADA